eukprot:378369_1
MSSFQITFLFILSLSVVNSQLCYISQSSNCRTSSYDLLTNPLVQILSPRECFQNIGDDSVVFTSISTELVATTDVTNGKDFSTDLDLYVFTPDLTAGDPTYFDAYTAAE